MSSSDAKLLGSFLTAVSGLQQVLVRYLTCNVRNHVMFGDLVKNNSYT